VSNRLDRLQLAIEVGISIAMAKLDELEAQSERLAELVILNAIAKSDAVDILYTAARGADLVRVHGDDHIQEVIAESFARCPPSRAPV
jgi:hypothetical protein